MRRSSIHTWIGMWCVLGMAAPVRAANPRITLKLDQVTCEQALESINRASGISVQLQGVPRPVDPTRGRLTGPLAKLNEPASFEWNNVPLGRVLRELGARYNLRFQQHGTLYSVMPGPPVRGAAKAPAGKPRYLVERDGFRLYPVSISVSSQRELNLEAGENRSMGERLLVGLKVEWPEGEPDALIGFDSIAARDDLGNVLHWNAPPGRLGIPQLGSHFPDEWVSTVQLLDPHPRARKLAWLEGELLVYGVYRSLSAEVALEGASLPASRKLADIELQLTRLELPAPAADPVLVRGPLVYTRLETGLEEGFGFPDRLQQLRPELVGASGKVYASRGTSSNGTTRDGRAVLEVRNEFPPIAEPIQKVVYRTVEKREPRRLVSFRFENLPIPPVDVIPPVVDPPVPAAAKRAGPGPFQAEGGVDLQLRTEVNGRPAPDGILSVGLARRDAEGWSSVRWQETEVEIGGLSRVRGLRPGKYRLLRNYRPRVALDPGGAGRWEGGELEIEVLEGKMPAIPPLRWAPSRGAAPAAAPPKAATKPLRAGGR